MVELHTYTMWTHSGHSLLIINSWSCALAQALDVMPTSSISAPFSLDSVCFAWLLSVSILDVQDVQVAVHSICC